MVNHRIMTKDDNGNLWEIVHEPLPKDVAAILKPDEFYPCTFNEYHTRTMADARMPGKQ